MPNPYQVKFFKGDVTGYDSDSSQYSGGIFFDTLNKDIYLNGDKYTEGRFMIIDDASVISSAGVPYILFDYTSNLGQSSFNAALPTIDGSNAIDVSLNHETNNFLVKLKINDEGLIEWLTQDSSGLKFNEDRLNEYIRQGTAGDMIEIGELGEINHAQIDVSTVYDSSTEIDFESVTSVDVIGSVEMDNFGHITKIHPAHVSFGEPVSYWNEID